MLSLPSLKPLQGTSREAKVGRATRLGLQPPDLDLAGCPEAEATDAHGCFVGEGNWEGGWPGSATAMPPCWRVLLQPLQRLEEQKANPLKQEKEKFLLDIFSALSRSPAGSQ